mmetsp:Transcript_12473/g.38449  ORF Transcript_12473/g.38449 Transcript_12473/m.38449 type:complete len:118 (-) Transcript_12473:41-394(-)
MQHFTSRPSDAPGGGGGGGGERVEELKGWLHKQSTNGRWQRRYFILRDQKLEYYRKPEDAQPGGTLELQGCAAKAHKDAERDFVIRIETEERPYHLAAGSGDDMSNWLLALRGHCGR